MAAETARAAFNPANKASIRYTLGALVRESTVAKLKALCKGLGLPISSKLKKAEIQEILCTFLDRAVSEYTGNELSHLSARFSRHLVDGPVPSVEPRARSAVAMSPNVSSVRARPVGLSNSLFPGQVNLGRMSTPTSVQQIYSQNMPSMGNFARPPPAPRYLFFYSSAFYKRHSLVVPVKVWQPPYHLSTTKHDSMSFSLSDEHKNFLKSDDHQLYFFAQEYMGEPSERRYVQFPPSFHISLDNVPLQLALKGSKKAPMSAKPIELPKNAVLNSKRGYSRLDYHMMVCSNISKEDHPKDKTFAFGLYTVQLVSVQEVVQKIQDRPHVSPEETIAQIVENMKADAAGDESPADMGVVESVYSLKDSVSCCRIQIPARSSMCNHIDCFDLGTYVELQQQAETCKCPICGNDIEWESIRVDDYFVNLLAKVDHDVESINILTDGSWTVKSYDDSSDESSSDDGRPLKRRKGPKLEIIDLDSDLGSDADETVGNISEMVQPESQTVQPEQQQPEPAQSGQSEPAPLLEAPGQADDVSRDFNQSQESNPEPEIAPPDQVHDSDHDSLADLDLAGLSDVTETFSDPGAPEGADSQHTGSIEGANPGPQVLKTPLESYLNGAHDPAEQSILFEELEGSSPGHPAASTTDSSLTGLLTYKSPPNLAAFHAPRIPSPPVMPRLPPRSLAQKTQLPNDPGSASSAFPPGQQPKTANTQRTLLSVQHSAPQQRQRPASTAPSLEIVDLTGDSD